MTGIIAKTWNSYRRSDGYVMSWERHDDGDGHLVTILDEETMPATFRWRAAAEPVAGQRVSVVLVESGVSARRDRPVLLLNHDTGDVLREQNAPSPRGTRPIMLALGVWTLVAMSISTLLIAHTEGLTMMTLTLVATAFVVWRFAIATSDLRIDERAQKRIQDEETLCLEILTRSWQMAAGENFMMKGGGRGHVAQTAAAVRAGMPEDHS